MLIKNRVGGDTKKKPLSCFQFVALFLCIVTLSWIVFAAFIVLQQHQPHDPYLSEFTNPNANKVTQQVLYDVEEVERVGEEVASELSYELHHGIEVIKHIKDTIPLDMQPIINIEHSIFNSISESLRRGEDPEFIHDKNIVLPIDAEEVETVGEEREEKEEEEGEEEAAENSPEIPPGSGSNSNIDTSINNNNNNNKRTTSKIHIVFSTDCSFFQDWQTLLVFHSALLVGQQGSITRIASGCEEAKVAELTALYKELFPQYFVHFTPDFKYDEKTKKKYDFYNKPYGLMHWLENKDTSISGEVFQEDDIIILIDPDFIFLRPITLKLLDNPNFRFVLNNKYKRSTYKNDVRPSLQSIPRTVSKGHPAANLYGLGAPWTQDLKEHSPRHLEHFNRTEVCGSGSPCLDVTTPEGEAFYSVGPPYLVEYKDLIRLTKSWTEFVPKVYGRYPNLLAEMYAYSMAAAHQDLPHTTIVNYMISNINMDEEGWGEVDSLENGVCEDPELTEANEDHDRGMFFYPKLPLPTFLHYCQFYRIAEVGFQKRRIKKTLFECDSPMLYDLPKNIAEKDYKNRDGEIISLPRKDARRGSFMLCSAHKAINLMLTYYKAKKCPISSSDNGNQLAAVVKDLNDSIASQGKITSEDLLKFHTRTQGVKITHFNTQATINLVAQKY